MKKLAYDHRVKTADGAEGLVRYVGTDHADIKLDDGTELTLPISELRRIPKVRLPPIEDMPDVRPVCQYCQKPLKPWTKRVYATHPSGRQDYGKVLRRVFESWQAYSGRWCTLDCAHRFANAAFLAGYRIQKGKP